MPSEPGGELRLHPSSLVFSVFSAARRLLLPGLLVLLFSRGQGFEIWLMILFVPTVAATVIKYVSFRYRFAADELVIREGVLTRKERHIPFARIQNVDISQNPIHRAFSVANVRIETAGGDEPEANIQVLSLERVEQMRRRVFEHRRTEADGDEQPGPPPAEPLLAMGPRDVLLYGIISNRGMAIVAAVLGIAWQASAQTGDDSWFYGFAQTIGYRAQAVRGWLPGSGEAASSPLATTLLAIVAVLALMLLLRLLSIVWAFLRLHRFRLVRNGDDLRTSFGLFTRMSATIPRRRIQLLSVRRTLLHRWFGRLEVRVATAGAQREGEDGGATRQLLAPLLREDRLDALVRAVQPGVELDRIEWRPVEKRAWRRIFRRTLLLQLVVAAGLWRFLPWLIPPLLGCWWLAAWKGYRHLAWARLPEAVAFRSGWLVQRTSVARHSKIQVVNLVQTPFDRRHRMGRVRVDTAGGGRVGHGVHVPYLDLERARELFRSLGGAAERTEFRW